VSTVTPNAWEDVDVGDWIRVGVGPYQYRRVSSKVSSLILGYEGVPLTGTGETVSIVRSYLSPSEPVSYYVDPLTSFEQATALKGIAQSLAQFRAVPVWPDQAGFVTGQDSQGNDVIELLPSYFLAAVAAGVCSVLPPERSLTGMAIGGVVSLKNSNDKFSTSQLNTIAEGGWSIFHIPNTGGSVQCRHLMSSDRSSIKRQEFSVTKNVDNQAKVLRNSLRPSLNDAEGRVNITQRFLQALALPIQGILDRFVANEQLVVGPNGEAPYALIDIRQDPSALDALRGEGRITANHLDILAALDGPAPVTGVRCRDCGGRLDVDGPCASCPPGDVPPWTAEEIAAGREWADRVGDALGFPPWGEPAAAAVAQPDAGPVADAVRGIVAEAVVDGSLCWHDGTVPVGVFDSERAVAIVDAACQLIADALAAHDAARRERDAGIALAVAQALDCKGPAGLCGCCRMALRAAAALAGGDA
jgi:hypothetical protein